jgi:Zn finger protein HypA/HybF involved in hydrogenase expression
MGCEHVFPLNGREYSCPECGGERVVATGGGDCRLDSIEVE